MRDPRESRAAPDHAVVRRRHHSGASDYQRVEQLGHLLDALSIERKGVIEMKRSRLNAIAYVSLILALFACGCEPLSRAKGGAVEPGAELKDLKNLEELRKLFNQDKGAPRLILLLSPT
jgi:hypothetical protein